MLRLVCAINRAMRVFEIPYMGTCSRIPRFWQPIWLAMFHIQRWIYFTFC